MRRKIGGYIWKDEIHKAIRANKAARKALGQIVDGDPGAARRALLLALIANQLGDNLESLYRLLEIANGKE